MEDTAPDYEPVFTDIYQYYSNSLTPFTNMIDALLLQLPILIKLKVQVPMSLYSVETAPVPLDAETYTGVKQEYSQIVPKTEYIALTEINYVPLMQTLISLCAKIGYMYYCKYTHLLKKCTEHTCLCVIYYDQSSQIKANKCKMIATFDTIPESKILDASNILILSNLQKPWMIVFKDVDRIFELEYSTNHVLNTSELCECFLTASNYLLSQTASNCGDMPEAKDGFFTTYYAFNKIVLDVLMEKFNIQVDDNTITQSALLHSDIPGYNLPALNFMSPPEEAQENHILEEEDSMISTHFEKVLIHMIDEQDAKILNLMMIMLETKENLFSIKNMQKYGNPHQLNLLICSFSM